MRVLQIFLFLLFNSIINVSSNNRIKLLENGNSFEHITILSDVVQRTEIKRILENLKFNATFYLIDDYRDNHAFQLIHDLCQQQKIRRSFLFIDATSNDVFIREVNVLIKTAFYYLATNYDIPLIDFNTRTTMLHNYNLFPATIHLVPSFAHVTEAWLALIERVQYRRLVFLTSSDGEGQLHLDYLRTLIDVFDYRIEHVLIYESGKKSYKDDLKYLNEYEPRVILFYANQHDAGYIFKSAKEMGLFEIGFLWIVNEEALNAQHPSIPPDGTIGFRTIIDEPFLRPFDLWKSKPFNNVDLISVLNFVYKTYIEVAITQLKRPLRKENFPVDECSAGTFIKFTTGKNLIKNLKNLVYTPTNLFKYQLLNMKHNVLNVVGEYKAVHGFKILNLQLMIILETMKMSYGSRLTLFQHEKLMWPGGSYALPKGVKVDSHLLIVTIDEIPFIFKRKGKNCRRNKSNYIREAYCPQLTTNGIVDYCCFGYCIDLLYRLESKLNFSFELHLVADNNYGDYNLTTKSWNGMVGEVLSKQADLIIAPLPINAERSAVIDFTKPFKYHGMILLMKKKEKDSSLTSFLQPFQYRLWLVVLLSVEVIAATLYLLDRFSPTISKKLRKKSFMKKEPSLENLKELIDKLKNEGSMLMMDEKTVQNKVDHEFVRKYHEDSSNDVSFLNSHWFTWGVLLGSGIGDLRPTSFSGRILGIVWAGFSMIVVSSYTANLAAFLVLDQPEASISGIDDVRLRNPQDEFRIATIKDSSVDKYFKQQVELSTMCRLMSKYNYNNPKNAIKDVLSGQLKAFIWHSSRLEYEAAKSCELVTVGDLFGRSSLGFGVKKGSLWASIISKQILIVHEEGFIEDLDNKWILLQHEPIHSNDNEDDEDEKKKNYFYKNKLEIQEKNVDSLSTIQNIILFAWNLFGGSNIFDHTSTNSFSSENFTSEKNQIIQSYAKYVISHIDWLKMRQLKKKTQNNNQIEATCPRRQSGVSEASAATLGIRNMAEVFMMVVVGLGIGICIVLAEIFIFGIRKKLFRNKLLKTRAVV
ncbi:hypothetical protein SNEBB_009579 [Seison nebaliae]|nr:hypothetical protein SNEBB_009579 [Seison nebaliae]